MLRPRNFIARSPLLRKGGVHQRSQTGQRHEQKQVLEQDILDWQTDAKVEDITELPEENSGNS